jgi:hypothetical protein
LLKLNAAAFYRAVSTLRRIELVSKFNNEPEISDEHLASVVGLAKDLQRSLLILGTKMTSIAVDRLLKRLPIKPFSYQDVAAEIAEIDSRLADELSLTNVFVIEDSKSDFFDPGTPLFSAAVHAKFPGFMYLT